MPDALMEPLLTHREKLRRLLVGLGGEHGAEDALPEIWIRSLRGSPREPAREREQVSESATIVRTPEEIATELESHEQLHRAVASEHRTERGA